MTHSIRCAHCKGTHATSAEVKACSTPTPNIAIAYTDIEGGDCTPGQKCKDILSLCSKHSMQYQNRWGRASNE